MPNNNAVIKRHLDPVIFKQYLHDHNTSIRQLGNLIETTERTIRRCVKQECVTLNIAIDICRYFECTFDEVFGPDNSKYWSNIRLKILKMIR